MFLPMQLHLCHVRQECAGTCSMCTSHGLTLIDMEHVISKKCH